MRAREVDRGRRDQRGTRARRRCVTPTHLVDDDVAHALQLELLPLEAELGHAAGRPHDQLRPLLLDLLQLPVRVGTAHDRGGREATAGERRLGNAMDLEGELA